MSCQERRGEKVCVGCAEGHIEQCVLLRDVEFPKEGGHGTPPWCLPKKARQAEREGTRAAGKVLCGIRRMLRQKSFSSSLFLPLPVPSQLCSSLSFPSKCFYKVWHGGRCGRGGR